MQRALLLLVFALLTLGADAGWAGESDWNSLNPQEQKLLKRFSADWETLPKDKRERLVTGARRWQGMSNEQRNAARDRYRQWRSLSPDEQSRIRRRYQEFRNLPAEERDRITRNYQHYKSLPADERKRLRTRFQQLTPEQRKEILRNRDVQNMRRKQQFEKQRTRPGSKAERKRRRVRGSTNTSRDDKRYQP